MRSAIGFCAFSHFYVGDKKFSLLKMEIEDPDQFYTRTLVCKVSCKYIFLVITILVLTAVIIWSSMTFANTQVFQFEKCE